MTCKECNEPMDKCKCVVCKDCGIYNGCECPGLPDIMQAQWVAHQKSKVQVWRAKSNNVSQLGHPCIRKLVYSRLIGDKRQPHGVRLQTVFDEGRLHEAAVKRALEDMGYVLECAEMPVEDKALQISGRVDGVIRYQGKVVPVEIKSISPWGFDKLGTPEEMLESSSLWVRLYPHQLNTYMGLMDAKAGLFVFKNKQTGQLKFIGMEFDSAMYEEDREVASIVNGWVEGLGYGVEVDYLATADQERLPTPTDECEWCVDCDFAQWACFPETSGTGVEFVDDADILAALNEREELETHVKRYKALDKSVKTFAKDSGGDQYIIDDWHIRIGEYEQTVYEVPDDIKQEYATKAVRQRVNIKRIKGE